MFYLVFAVMPKMISKDFLSWLKLDYDSGFKDGVSYIIYRQNFAGDFFLYCNKIMYFLVTFIKKSKYVLLFLLSRKVDRRIIGSCKINLYISKYIICGKFLTVQFCLILVYPHFSLNSCSLTYIIDLFS